MKSPAGLEALHNFLADKSYIDGWTPSQGDVVVFNALSGSPDGKFVHVLRWYNQIASYQKSEWPCWPGVAKALEEYGPQGTASSKDDDDDDDDDDDEDDDNFDLFGSEDEEESAEAERLKQERLEAYAAKKAKKPALIAKSNIILDVKPWDDETDMAEVEKMVRSIEADGLLWGASKLVPLAYGIKKLQISCVVEDDKIGTDFLEESITAFEDHIQSVDIAAFNKV